MHGTFQSNGGVPTRALGNGPAGLPTPPTLPGSTVARSTGAGEDPRTKSYIDG